MKKRFLSLILVLAMMVGVFTPLIANAAEETTETVTLHKILMDTTTFGKFTEGTTGNDGTKYIGNKIEETNKPNKKEKSSIKSFFGDGAKEIEGVYFALKFAADYKDTDKQGKYVKADTTNKLKPASPLVATENVEDAVGGLTKAKDAGVEFITTGLKGNFEIDEIHDKSTYKGANGETLTDMKAVPTKITLPLVNDNGVVTNAHVYPKNTEEAPKIDKNFLKNNELTEAEKEAADKLKVGADYNNYQAKKATAKAEVGKQIPYEVKTEIPAKSNLAEAKWDDKMTEGLTYKKGSLVVKIGKETIKPTSEELTETDKGFTLRLKGNNLAKLNGNDAAVTVVLTYSATVNSNAIADIPEANDITFHYGNTPSQGTTPLPTKPNENGEVKVEKTWDEGSKFVDGEWAKFKLVDANTGEDVKSTDLVNAPEDYKFEGTVTLSKGTTENYTWKYLNKDKQYKVVEVESKTLSDAEYTEAKDGTIKVTNHKSNNPKPLNPTEPKVVTGGKKFVKTNQDGSERLAGAEFYVKNAQGKYLVADQKDATKVTEAKKALDKAVEKYNGLDADKQTDEEKAKVTAAQEAYNKAFKENSIAYKWEDKADNAVVLTSDGQGRFEITGLEYGEYKLEEAKAPEGFAKLNKDEEQLKFKVEKGSYTTIGDIDYSLKLKQGEIQTKAQKIINKKVTIPQTGGIGTIIFTAIGLAIMASAIIAIKKRQATEAR